MSNKLNNEQLLEKNLAEESQRPPELLTLSNHPPNVAVFKAAGWEDALNQMQKALIDDALHSAVWFMEDEASIVELERIRKNLFDQFFAASEFDKNFKIKAEALSNSRHPLIDTLSPDARAGFATISRHGKTDVIQRYQISTPPESGTAHFDLAVQHVPRNTQLSNKPGSFLKGRGTRFLFSELGQGPVVYGPPKSPLQLLNEGYGTGISRGIIENVEDLGTAWQIPGRTLTAITGQDEWGMQAIAHRSRKLDVKPADFRALTVFNLNY